MLRVYNVYSGRLHIDMVYAYTEEQACEMGRKKWGDPMTYTITGDGIYWAREA
jgi:hypothetical protein